VDAVVDLSSWDVPRIFRFIKERGNVPDEEMFRTFNMGIGMCVVVSKEDMERAVEVLNASGERAFPVGTIKKGSGKVVLEQR